MMTNETMEAKAAFTAAWMEFAAKHGEHMRIGDWVHIFATLTGTALALAEVDESDLPTVVSATGDIINNVYAGAVQCMKQPQPPLQ
jgi:hypothetical protein